MTFLGVFVAVLGAITVAAYLRDWNWTGMVAAPEGAATRNKTLWDWLGLLIVPAVLAAGAYGINSAQTDRDQKRESARLVKQDKLAAAGRREDALRAYLQQMSGLIANPRLEEDTRLKGLATSLTLVVLRQLDGQGRGQVAQFLADADLIPGGDDELIVDLENANLRGAKLADSYLMDTYFSGDLSGADLRGALISGADFSQTNLRGADFREAVIDGVDFSETNLRGANFSGTGYTGDLQGANFRDTCLTDAKFTGATLPNSSFEGAEGRNLDFTGASFERADFKMALLMNVKARGTKYGDATEKTFPEGWGPQGVPKQPYGKSGPCKRKVEKAP